MLVDLPFDAQVHILSFLERIDIYQACLVSRRLNEAASCLLYTEPVWSVGCCEPMNETSSTLDAAFTRRPYLIRYARALILIAGLPRLVTPPRMPNLRELEFIPCHKCQRQWDDTSTMHLMRFFHKSPVPKVSIVGSLGNTCGTEGLLSFGFIGPENHDEGHDLQSYMHHGTLLHLDVMASSSVLSHNEFTLSNLCTLNVQGITHMKPVLVGIKDLPTLKELSLECSVWSQKLPSEQWEWLSCDLPSLRNIHLRTGQHFIGEVSFQRLCELFQRITVRSFTLESIYLGSTPPRLNPPFPCETLVQGIIGRNKESLRSLRVSAASLSAYVLSQLLTECRLLSRLHISGCQSDLYTMALSIPHAVALRDVHFGLELPANVADPQTAIEELLNARHSLRSFIVYMPTRYKWGSEVMWKWSWEFDTEKFVATRVTLGPMARDIESVPIPRMHDTSDTADFPDDAMEITPNDLADVTLSLKT